MVIQTMDVAGALIMFPIVSRLPAHCDGLDPAVLALTRDSAGQVREFSRKRWA